MRQFRKETAVRFIEFTGETEPRTMTDPNANIATGTFPSPGHDANSAPRNGGGSCGIGVYVDRTTVRRYANTAKLAS